ncbi:hypothetical protein GH714_011323 [Hevea brasiliensis]|uniref:Uncharacterized protein n=1 Tax=Hevea brasiliensis TaxID=3981 RepID=A0A6A6KCV8_HEVBR|nr:hypothetical protein GH714_011323 [Hevea brasiliensis]
MENYIESVERNLALLDEGFTKLCMDNTQIYSKIAAIENLLTTIISGNAMIDHQFPHLSWEHSNQNSSDNLLKLQMALPGNILWMLIRCTQKRSWSKVPSPKQHRNWSFLLHHVYSTRHQDRKRTQGKNGTRNLTSGKDRDCLHEERARALCASLFGKWLEKTMERVEVGLGPSSGISKRGLVVFDGQRPLADPLHTSLQYFKRPPSHPPDPVQPTLRLQSVARQITESRYPALQRDRTKEFVAINSGSSVVSVSTN